MSNVEQLPVKGTSERPVPKRIIRPCEYGMWNAVKDMETQMGTVEAYNRLCDWAQALKEKIDSGEAQPQHKMFATDPKWIYPAGHHD